MTLSAPATGKRIVVLTGASRGIGAAIALRLACAADHILLTGRDADKLRTVASQVQARGGSAEALPCDLTDPAQIDAFAADVLGRHRRCDVLINNAGLGHFSTPLHTLSPSDWERTMALNLRAPYLLLRAFAPSMIAAGGGHIINISSLAGKNPLPGAAAYAASKWGLNGLMYSAAEELRAHKIRVSLICPGSTQTEFAGGMSAKKSALGALAPDDVAHVVAMLLAQSDASFVSEVLIRPTMKS
jgi:NAD(P)-dependent dehydrogenase (short-subunit alcohol dehydrogenase family)